MNLIHICGDSIDMPFETLCKYWWRNKYNCVVVIDKHASLSYGRHQKGCDNFVKV